VALGADEQIPGPPKKGAADGMDTRTYSSMGRKEERESQGWVLIAIETPGYKRPCAAPGSRKIDHEFRIWNDEGDLWSRKGEGEVQT